MTKKSISKSAIGQNVDGNMNNYSKAKAIFDFRFRRFQKYNAFLDIYLQDKKALVKESTIAKYSRIIEKHIKPYLGNMRICDITDGILSGFLQNLTSNGETGLSPKSVSDIMSVVKNSLSFAASCGRVLNCNFKNIYFGNRKKEIKIISESRQKILVEYLTRDIDCYKFGILLSLCTGMRVGEICALQWRDLDFENKTIRISKTIQRVKNLYEESGAKTKIIITEPKSPSSIRSIPIPTCIYGYAKKMQGADRQFVVSGKNGGYTEPRTMQNKFYQYEKICGLPRLNFHSLRHTFATRRVEVGFDIKCLSEILGHSNINITLDRYVHPSFETKRKNMDRIRLI